MDKIEITKSQLKELIMEVYIDGEHDGDKINGESLSNDERIHEDEYDCAEKLVKKLFKENTGD